MADRNRPGRRPVVRVVIVIVGVAAVATGGVLVVEHVRAAGPPTVVASVPTGVVRVIRTDLSTVTQVDGTLGYAGSDVVVNQDDGVFTALPALGQVLGRGQAGYEVDGRPVIVFYGARPAWRPVSAGVPDGADIGQLKENLVALGFAPGWLPMNNHFDTATTAAVRRWQASLGLAVTGAVGVGDVVYVPGPIRVTAVQAEPGSPARAGATLLSGTGTDRVVHLSLPVAQQYLVAVGNAVTVTLPDGRTTTPGTVTAVSSVASAQTSDGTGGGAAGSNAGASAAGSAPLFVDVTVRLTDPAATGNVDQAPVTVNVTDQSVHGVLAVPVNALVALAEGGYAVEIVDRGARHLVGVRTGLFANSLVEVSGAGIEAGAMVAVPAS